MVKKIQLKDGIQVLDMESHGQEQPILVQSGGKYLQLKGDAKALMNLLRQSPCTTEELEASLRRIDSEPGWDLARILSTLERLHAYSLVEIPGQKFSAREGTVRPRREASWMLTLPLFRPRHITWLTRLFSRFLAPSLVFVGLPVLLVVQIFVWIRILHPIVGSASALTATVHALTPRLFWLLALGNYLGLFIHELGHAAACVRCGISPGPIGVCLYWVLPGFYTEVNQAWRLPARKRLLVDAGGIFFSLICATLALLCYLATGRMIFALLCSIYDVTVAINLVPFLRMDGYWMISDGLGIPNLMRVNKELTQWLVLRLLGIQADDSPVFGMGKYRKYSYLVYYLGFLIFTLFFLWKITVWYIPQLAHLLGTAVTGLVISLQGHRTGDALKNILKLIVVTLPAVGLFVYFGRAARRSLSWAMNVFSAQPSIPKTS